MLHCRLLVPLAALALALAQTPSHGANTALSFQQLADSSCTTAGQSVDEKGYVRIGGIEQWVRIKGSNCANPIVVLIHGGPGNPTTLFADKFYQSWEKHYTVVQWDQRGAGMTYARNPVTDDVPLVIEQLRDDGIEVARFAAQRFGKRKVILLGGSWSSILGVYMVKAAPTMFCGYVSTSQVVAGPLPTKESVEATLALAPPEDRELVARIKGFGALPWTDPRAPGVLRRMMRKYEAMSTDPVPKVWMETPPEYDTPAYEAAYTAGEDYSWLQFVGLKGDGIGSKVDLYKLGPKFDVPFYMVQGEQDLLTMPGPSRRYFDFIEAPHKEYVVVPRAGHDPNPAVVETQLQLLQKIGACR